VNEPEHRKAPIPDLERFVRDVLIAAGVAAEEATLVAAEVVDAEARGYESQGLMRVTPYVKAAQSGDTRSPTSLEPIRDAPSAFAWDAGFGWGHVAASRAMAECAARARRTGSCVATIRNIGHIGRLGYYVEQAAALGVVGFISCCGNASSAVVAPWGGKEARLSTNPFAYGFDVAGRARQGTRRGRNGTLDPGRLGLRLGRRRDDRPHEGAPA